MFRIQLSHLVKQLYSQDHDVILQIHLNRF